MAELGNEVKEAESGSAGTTEAQETGAAPADGGAPEAGGEESTETGVDYENMPEAEFEKRKEAALSGRPLPAPKAPDGQSAKAKDDVAAADEKEAAELLKALDLTTASVPKELIPHLKKMHGRINQQLSNEQAQRERWGAQNAELARRNRELEKELSGFKSSPESRRNALQEAIKKIPQDKLTEEQRKLLSDGDLTTVIGLIMDASGRGAAEEKQPDAREAGSGHELTEQERQEYEKQARDLAEREGKIIEEAGFKEIGKTYSSPEFREWMTKTVQDELSANTDSGIYTRHIRVLEEKYQGDPKRLEHEISMLLSPSYAMFTTPKATGHVRLLKAFDAHRNARKALAEKDEADRKRKSDLGGIGDTSKAAASSSDIDYLGMSDEDFDKVRTRALAGQGR